MFVGNKTRHKIVLYFYWRYSFMCCDW